jgi:hypothetical protein
MTLESAALTPRIEEPPPADSEDTTARIETLISDSAQKSMEESRVEVKKIVPDKKEKSTIDYDTFNLPGDKERYLQHVNQDNRKIYTEEIIKEDGKLVLHLFSVVTTLI